MLHPPVLVVGVGCARGAAPEELIELVETTLATRGLAAGAVACVASLDLKADEPAVHALAERLGVPARFFSAEELERERPRLATPSEIVFQEVGCHGVAEGAALAAAGADASLFVTKTKSAQATCAIARARLDIDPARAGRPRGRLTIVGIGPGQRSWRTPEATAALAAADDVVGYGLYLDLIADLIAGKACHTSELAEEEQRVRRALDLAAAGRRVCLVSSGDAGIYALATLAFELPRGGEPAGVEPDRDHRGPGHLGAAGGRGADRRAARPRLLHRLALGPADALGGDRAPAGRGRRRRLRRRPLQPGVEAQAGPARGRARHPASSPPARQRRWCWPATSAAKASGSR